MSGKRLGVEGSIEHKHWSVPFRRLIYLQSFNTYLLKNDDWTCRLAHATCSHSNKNASSLYFSNESAVKMSFRVQLFEYFIFSVYHCSSSSFFYCFLLVLSHHRSFLDPQTFSGTLWQMSWDALKGGFVESLLIFKQQFFHSFLHFQAIIQHLQRQLHNTHHKINFCRLRTN